MRPDRVDRALGPQLKKTLFYAILPPFDAQPQRHPAAGGPPDADTERMQEQSQNATISDAPGSQTSQRHNRTGVALPHGVTLTMLGLLAAQPVLADAPVWDCRMGPDGRSWQCLKQGAPVDEASTAAAQDVEPAMAELPQRPGGPLAETAATVPAAAAVAAPQAAATPPAATSPASPPAPVEPAAPAAPAPRAAPATTAAPAALPEAFSAAAPPRSTTAAPSAVMTTPGSPPASQAFHAQQMPDVTRAAPTQEPAPAGMPDLTAPLPAAKPAPTSAAGIVATPGEAVDSVPGVAPRASIDDGIDWGTCPVRQGSSTTPKISTRSSDIDTGGPVEVTADNVVAQLDPQQAVFSGNVVLVQNATALQADEISINRDSGEVMARGGFLLTRPEIRFAGDSADYQINTHEARVDNASYRIPEIHARGDAERAAFLGNGISQFDNITYTTCAPDDTSWQLRAEGLELDQNEGFGTASNATLRFKGVPVLYAPTFTFPIDDRRRSGVLVPSVGYSNNTGADVSVPYYFNLAENYDLTLTPRVMSKRGLMLGSEFRFLTESSDGTFAADVLPHDSEYGDTRGSASLYSITQFNARTQGRLRLNYASDSDYFSDLGGSLAATSATHLERAGEIVYHADTWQLFGRAQYYQTIDDDILTQDRPYARLPQLRAQLEHPDGLAGTTYHFDAEYVNFYRSDSVRGHRISLAPAISLPFGDTWWYAEPKIGAFYTTYKLTDQVAGLTDTPSHSTGMLSFDSGLYYDRAMSYFGNAATQTLEPRLYYLYVPSSEQNDQPLFDTAMFDFTFDNLFRENRFNGPDRVGDANQVTLAMTTRVLDDARGTELLRASIGQIYYFEDRKVTLRPGQEADDSSSALVGEVAAALGGNWRSRAGLQWDPHDGNNGTIDQALAQITYSDERRHVFNAAYRLRDGEINQTDLAFFWPVNAGFSVIGRHYYSLRDDRLLEALAGVEYGKCCWRVRALVRKYTDGAGDNHNLAFLLQLELSGLGRLGNDIDSTLERGVYGYRIDDEN